MILPLPQTPPQALLIVLRRDPCKQKKIILTRLKKEGEMFSWVSYISYFLSVFPQTTPFQQERVDLPFTPLTSLVFSLRIYLGVKLLFASCIFLTYFLQFYVPMVIIQPVILKHVPEEYQDVADFAIRAATVIFTCEYKPIIVFKGVLLRWYCCFSSILCLSHY